MLIIGRVLADLRDRCKGAFIGLNHGGLRVENWNIFFDHLVREAPNHRNRGLLTGFLNLDGSEVPDAEIWKSCKRILLGWGLTALLDCCAFKLRDHFDLFAVSTRHSCIR